ncbi:MAG: hypothetical protein HC836_38455 [Richelia sp. RM2_1_2]|nr:hypothetical protein [Richelia sp. RM2_1_2]
MTKTTRVIKIPAISEFDSFAQLQRSANALISKYEKEHKEDVVEIYSTVFVNKPKKGGKLFTLLIGRIQEVEEEDLDALPKYWNE